MAVDGVFLKFLLRYVEIVKILLDNGADPYVENSLGMNAFHICNEFGPYPRVMDLLSKY